MVPPRPCVHLEWPGKGPDPADPGPTPALEVARPGHPACMLIQGDNLHALRALRARAPSSFALVYLDPPFFTKRQHHLVRRQLDRASGEIIRGVVPAFDDRWEGLDQYLSALRARLVVARDLVTPDGSLVVHVDPKTSHYVKVLGDEVFGPDCFASEIIWRYRRWPSKTPNFQRVHDVLLRYVRDATVAPRFRQLYEPLAPSTIATWGDRRQRAVVDDLGRRRRSSTVEEATPGTPLGDVWEIGIVAPVARERTGYPTQKPEALLSRLLEACTHPGDLVLDPCAGSGTTLVVATKLGRRVVGIDESAAALEITRRRLRGLGVHPLEERVVFRTRALAG
ncbi:MAG: site-specific DNA-methyltransferase [Polyangiaceae bacterium]|nr:site-specific DNA-methyltransferase [Polyangiaceae bacterium]